MASVPFNVSKGREVEFFNRVDGNDPTNCAFVLMVLKSGSANGVNGLQDFDTFAAILAGGYTEVGNSGYARKIVTDSGISPYTVDDTNNRILLTLPLQTFTGIGAAGDVWDIGVWGYDPDTTGGTDSAIIPITGHELRTAGGIALVPDGTNPLVVDPSAGWVAAV
jgi:hypothetical protein